MKYSDFQIDQNDTFVVEVNDMCSIDKIHGEHPIITFEVMGPNLLDLMRSYQAENLKIPIRLVKKITRQILVGLDYMHRVCNIIHTDIKLENIAF